MKIKAISSKIQEAQDKIESYTKKYDNLKICEIKKLTQRALELKETEKCQHSSGINNILDNSQEA